MNPQKNKSGSGLWRGGWAVMALACLGLCVLWSWYAGKDMNWDSLNYHYYVAYQWMTDRLSQDFMAASIQSYLNPLSYLPFYWMVSAGWNSLAVGSALAALHGLNLLLIGWMTALLLPPSLRYRPLWIVVSVLLAAVNPIFASETGSSFNDITTTIPVLAGYVLFFRSIGTVAASGMQAEIAGWRKWFWPGLLLGVAVGLKLTNAVFALGLLAVLPFVRDRNTRWPSRLFWYGLGGIAGFLLINGTWAWQLYSRFGNPLFPYFNGLFASPDFPAFNIRNYRFVPDSLSQALSFPWNALRVASDVYTEPAAPDTRWLALFLLGCCLLAGYGLRRYRARIAPSPAPASVAWGRLLPLLAACAVSYVLWLYTSGNGRYFMPASLLLGPLLVCFSLSLIGSNRFSVYLLGLLLAVQCAQVGVGAQHRWSPGAWTDAWFDVKVPAQLESSPYLYLAPAGQSGMFVVPFLHPDSAFSNISGQVPLAPGVRGGQRVEQMIARFGQRIRGLYPVVYLDASGLPAPRAYTMYEHVFGRFGLMTDTKACELIQVDLRRATTPLPVALAAGRSPRLSWLMSCALIPAPAPASTDTSRRVDQAFDRVERTCPRLFSPGGVITDRLGEVWLRRYVNSDIVLAWMPGEEIQYLYYSGGDPVRVGALEAWEKEPAPKVDCRIKKLPPFGLKDFF